MADRGLVGEIGVSGAKLWRKRIWQAIAGEGIGDDSLAYEPRLKGTPPDGKGNLQASQLRRERKEG